LQVFSDEDEGAALATAARASRIWQTPTILGMLSEKKKSMRQFAVD
jgi:hypothetical protein